MFYIQAPFIILLLVITAIKFTPIKLFLLIVVLSLIKTPFFIPAFFSFSIFSLEEIFHGKVFIPHLFIPLLFIPILLKRKILRRKTEKKSEEEKKETKIEEKKEVELNLEDVEKIINEAKMYDEKIKDLKRRKLEIEMKKMEALEVLRKIKSELQKQKNNISLTLCIVSGLKREFEGKRPEIIVDLENLEKLKKIFSLNGTIEKSFDFQIPFDKIEYVKVERIEIPPIPIYKINQNIVNMKWTLVDFEKIPTSLDILSMKIKQISSTSENIEAKKLLNPIYQNIRINIQNTYILLTEFIENIIFIENEINSIEKEMTKICRSFPNIDYEKFEKTIQNIIDKYKKIIENFVPLDIKIETKVPMEEREIDELKMKGEDVLAEIEEISKVERYLQEKIEEINKNLKEIEEIIGEIENIRIKIDVEEPTVIISEAQRIIAEKNKKTEKEINQEKT